LVGDEHGAMSVLKYSAEDGKLVDMPYHLNPDCLVGDCKSYFSYYCFWNFILF